MPFVYVQHTGSYYGPDRALISRAYSGRGPGLNNPREQGVVGEGPIPVGRYTIGDPQDPVGHLGRLAMPLIPNPGTNTFGRSAFFMHGDNSLVNHTASHGCIILPPGVRQDVCDDPEDQLVVVAEEADVKGAYA